MGALTSVLATLALVTGPAHAAPSEPGPPIAGSIGLRLVDAPATAADDPRAQMYVVDHLRPGSVIHRRVEVTNGTTDVAHVALYSTAASIERGTFVGADERTQNELTTWTSVTPSASDVAPNGRTMATVTVTVPTDAAPGERYGVVWAEVRSTPANDDGVTQVSRVGVRLYISVGVGAAPAADFVIESLAATRSAGGEPLVIATVRNTGGRALDLSGSFQLDDGPAGLTAGPFPATLGVTLELDATEEVSITLDPLLPSGPWRASITLHSGLILRASAVTLTFPDVGSAAAVPTPEPAASGSFLRGPTVGILVGLSAAIAVAVLAWRRHTRTRVTSGV